MQAPLLSPHWYRIAKLHPQLKPHVSVTRQEMRGKVWYVLHSEIGRRYQRVSALAYELIGRLDGRLSVDELWNVLLKLHGDSAPTQDEVIRVLGQMTDAGLVQAEVAPDVRRLAPQRRRRQKQVQRSKLNPFAFRLPLFDPTGLMQRCSNLSRLIFNPGSFILWAFLMAVGGSLAWDHRSGLVAQSHALAQSPRSLLWLWLVYPVMKVLHELGHALALRRYGCESHELGVSFMLLMPLPYIDASASLSLPMRRQRALISAAGIMVELALASVAMLVWVQVENSWLKDLAFTIMCLGGLSTVLFNGNPLMRYDGYYLLMDVLDVPNLAEHSVERWRNLISRMLLKFVGRSSQRASDGARVEAGMDQIGLTRSGDRVESALWTLYAPASWAYRIVLMFSLDFWLAKYSLVLALAFGCGVAYSLFVQPIINTWRVVATRLRLQNERHQVLGLGIFLALTTVFEICVIPWAGSVVTQGVIWPSEHAQVRAMADGEIVQLLAHDGQKVSVGQALIVMENPELSMRVQAMRARLQVDQTQVAKAWMTDALDLANAQAVVARDEEILAQLTKDENALTLHAERNGVFVLPQANDWAHRQVTKGQAIAYVIDPSQVMVRAVVDEREVASLRSRLRSVSVRLDESIGTEHPARLVREVPAAAYQLPSSALAERNGGPFATDPQDNQMLRTQGLTYLFDVALPETALGHLGGRAYVRFELTKQTLWQRLCWRFKQLFLQHFADAH